MEETDEQINDGVAVDIECDAALEDQSLITAKMPASEVKIIPFTNRNTTTSGVPRTLAVIFIFDQICLTGPKSKISGQHS